MIFDNANASFRFISAVYISDKLYKAHISGRTFCALSFRIDSDTCIVGKDVKFNVENGNIVFFPSNYPYNRISQKDKLIAVHFEVFNDFSDSPCVFKPKDSSKYYALFISEGYLRRIFRKESELSPKRYLNKLRIQHAVSLVNSGFFSISQISEMVGFYDPKYFSAVYKKYLESLPSKYNDSNQF